MFDPIQAPDVHRGPATGHTTEYGTTWQEATNRINAAFKELFERVESHSEWLHNLPANPPAETPPEQPAA